MKILTNLTLLLIFTFLFCGPISAQTPEKFVLENIEVRAGEKATEKDIERSVNGFINIARELGILTCKPLKFMNQVTVIRDQTLRSERDGLFYSLESRTSRSRKTSRSATSPIRSVIECRKSKPHSPAS